MLKIVTLLILITSIAGIAFFKFTSSNNPPPPAPQTPDIPPNNQQVPPPQKLAPPPPPPAKDLLSKSVFYEVPFTSQSPFHEWKDPRQQDGCEEASVLMAIKWAKNETIKDKQAAKDEILAISKFQEEKYGQYRDTSATDTMNWIAKDYYKFDNVELKENVTKEDLIQELHKGNLVILPMNGRALGNPYFTQPGPERHMLLLTGYDAETDEFVTNDPGTSNGEDYRYPVEIFMNAIRDYQTGYHIPIVGIKKNMIVIQP